MVRRMTIFTKPDARQAPYIPDGETLTDPPSRAPVASVSRRDRPSRDLTGPDSRTADGLTALVTAMRASRASR